MLIYMALGGVDVFVLWIEDRKGFLVPVSITAAGLAPAITVVIMYKDRVRPVFTFNMHHLRGGTFCQKDRRYQEGTEI